MRLKVGVDIRAVLALKPSVINFGRIKKGTKSPGRPVFVIGEDQKNTEITSIKSENQFVNIEKIFDNEGNHLKYIEISILPGMKVGPFKEQIMISTNHKEYMALPLYVRGEIVGNITVMPTYLPFGIFRKGERLARLIRLKAVPGSAFKVLSAESTNPDLIVEVDTIEEGSEYVVKVFTEKGFNQDYIKGKIKITTDDNDQKNIEIGVFGKAFDEKLQEKFIRDAAEK